MSASFLVTSYGRTATYWLTSILNGHPQIFCSHGPDPNPTREDYDRDSEPDRVRRIHASLDEFGQLEIHEFLARMEERNPGYEVYGNVHGYGALTAATVIGDGPNRPALVNMTRHPVTRVESLMAEWRHELSYDPWARANYRSAFDDKWALLRIVPGVGTFCADFDDPSNWLWVNAAFTVLNNDESELRLDIPHMPMERLTRDLEMLLWLMHTVTQGQVHIDPHALAETASIGPRNASREAQTSSTEIYASWKPWQRALFHYLLREGRHADCYDRFGYHVPALA